MADLLQLAGVNTHIGQYHILQGVDFAVARNSLTMLLGRNGAGKTTCLRTIMGLWSASAGTIRYEGREIQTLKTPDVARLGMRVAPRRVHAEPPGSAKSDLAPTFPPFVREAVPRAHPWS